MGKLSSEQRGLTDFAEQIVGDSDALQRYNETKDIWMSDQLRIERFECQRIYSHRVTSGLLLARESLIHVIKDTWCRDDQAAAYMVVETKLTSDELAIEYVVQASSVDKRRHLWLQIADPASLRNWPAGKHPSYFAVPRDQKRLEIDLTPSYHASEAKYKAGLTPAIEFIDSVGLEAMIRQLQSGRQPEPAGDYQLAAA